MTQYDEGYKKLFTHPEMISSLMQNWVQADWIADLDFSTLEKHNSEFIGDTLGKRNDDMIWSMRFRDTELYIFLLLEFQSTVDQWMAARIPVYTGMFYQDLINSKKLKVGDKVPPTFPLVLYNGEKQWNAPTNTLGLIEGIGQGFREYQLQQEYFLIDEARLDKRNLSRIEDITAVLFELEQNLTVQTLPVIIRKVYRLLRTIGNPQLTKDMHTWMNRVSSQRYPQLQEEVHQQIEQMEGNMFAQQLDKVMDEARMEGLLKGKEEGKLEGEVLGRMQGSNEKARDIAMQLFSVLDLETISTTTGLTVEELKKLQKESDKKFN